MCHKNILHAKFHSSNLIIEEFGNVPETRIKFMKISQDKNVSFFFHMAFYSSKEIGCKKIANFAGYFLRNGKKDYFFLPKIFELLPAKLNFSRIPKDFQIYHMV